MSVGAIRETLSTARFLRSQAPDDLIVEHRQGCRKAFTPRLGSLPVLVCARNEADDLPATLVSIARSNTPVVPIVVNNDSTDATAEIATTMGAVVIDHAPRGKSGAFRVGMEYALDAFPGSPLLSTDADTIVGSSWAETMTHSAVNAGSTHNGALLFGGVVISAGESRITDATRTISLNGKQVISRLAHRQPGARGANVCVVGLAELQGAISDIPDATFPCSDSALRDAILGAGGGVHSTIRPESQVVSRGDRYSQLLPYLRVAFGVAPPGTAYQS